MTQFKTQHERDAAAQALGYQSNKPTQWTNIPPMFSGRQVAGTSGASGLGILGLGKYEMPDGSHQVSFGLAQPALDAYRSMRYGLGYEQDPAAPPGYVSEEAISRGASGAAGAIATGGIAATTVARAAGQPAVPDNAAGVFGFGKKRTSDSDTFEYGPADGSFRSINDGGIYITKYDNPRHVDDLDAGIIRGNLEDDGVKIGTSRLSPEFQGQGIGTAMYKHFIDKVHQDGHHFKSDQLVSHDASKVYERLKKLGYDVRKNPDANRGPGHTSASNHVYRIAKPGTPGDEFFSSGIPGLHATEDDY